MWGYDWELGSSDMTAIIAVKARDGIVVHSDSLAMNLQYYEDEDIVANLIDRIGKHRQKVFKVSRGAVICFTGNNFPLDLMKPIANALKDTAKNKKLEGLVDIAKEANVIIKRELNKGQVLEALLVGFDSMYFVDKSHKVTEVKENYFALGAGQLVSYMYKQRGHTVPLFNNVDAADKQADALMEYLAEQERLAIEAGDNDWHIGGKVKRLHITADGVINKPVARTLPVRVALGQVFDLTVKEKKYNSSNE